MKKMFLIWISLGSDTTNGGIELSFDYPVAGFATKGEAERHLKILEKGEEGKEYPQKWYIKEIDSPSV